MKQEESDSTSSLSVYEKHVDFLHKFLEDSIARADQKATIFLSILSVGFLFILNNSDNNVILDFLKEMKNQAPFYSKIIIVFFMVMIFVFGLSIFFAFLAVFPRLKDSSRNLIYWGIISELKSTEYLKVVYAQTRENFLEIKLRHCHELSIICDLKYKWLKRSMLFATIGLIIIFMVQIGFSILVWEKPEFFPITIK